LATFRFVELLLSRGAQVDVRNKKGNSSLWLAANGGHLDVVQLLYSAGRHFFIRPLFSFFFFFLLFSQSF
jgi:ankyrin repeat protein